jgi:hypothetical protein
MIDLIILSALEKDSFKGVSGGCELFPIKLKTGEYVLPLSVKDAVAPNTKTALDQKTISSTIDLKTQVETSWVSPGLKPKARPSRPSVYTRAQAEKALADQGLDEHGNPLSLGVEKATP